MFKRDTNFFGQTRTRTEPELELIHGHKHEHRHKLLKHEHKLLEHELTHFDPNYSNLISISKTRARVLGHTEYRIKKLIRDLESP